MTAINWTTISNPNRTEIKSDCGKWRIISIFPTKGYYFALEAAEPSYASGWRSFKSFKSIKAAQKFAMQM